MKREFLKGLELPDEVIEKIMSEHGKTTQSLQTQLTATQEQVTALNSQITERDNDINLFQTGTNCDRHRRN